MMLQHWIAGQSEHVLVILQIAARNAVPYIALNFPPHCKNPGGFIAIHRCYILNVLSIELLARSDHPSRSNNSALLLMLVGIGRFDHESLQTDSSVVGFWRHHNISPFRVMNIEYCFRPTGYY